MPREEIRDYFINKQILTIDTFQSTQVDLIPEIKAQDIRMHDSVISRFLVNCAHLFQKEHPSKVRNVTLTYIHTYIHTYTHTYNIIQFIYKCMYIIIYFCILVSS